MGAMQLGMIGLGRMGANMVRRLMAGGHECVVYDVDAEAVDRTRRRGRHRARSARRTSSPPSTTPATSGSWCRPRSSTRRSTTGPAARARRHDHRRRQLVVPRRHRPRRPARARHGIHYLDVGTSGGIYGLERGYCLMVGGDDDAVARLAPIFDTLAPGWATSAPHARPRRRPGVGRARLAALRPGRRRALREDGAQRHRVRADGGLRRGAQRARQGRHRRARTTPPTPRRHRWPIRSTTSTTSTWRTVTEVWRRGSVVASWLLDLTAEALHADPALSRFAGNVSDSGEGRWTVHAAIDEGVPVPVLSAALYERFSSRAGPTSPTRCCRRCGPAFGGHVESPTRRAAGRADDRPMTEPTTRSSPPPTPSCCSAPPATSPSEAVPGALPPRAARQAQHAGDRRRPQRLDRRGVPQARPGRDHRRRPDARAAVDRLADAAAST